jgi:hypothetical protein
VISFRFPIGRPFWLLPAGIALAALALFAPPALAAGGFGVERFEAPVTEQGGSPATQAGSHPYALNTTIVFKQHFDAEYQKANAGSTGMLPNGEPKDVEVNLPAGLVVNPLATERRCTEAEIEAFGSPCPPASAVGEVTFETADLGVLTEPVYNMVPPSGIPADLAFDAVGVGAIVHIVGKVRSGADYGLSAETSNLTQKAPVDSVSVTLWGDPSAESHDGQRGHCAEEGGCLLPVERIERPFLTLPGSCAGPLTATMTADSWQEPGMFPPEPVFEGSSIIGCEKLAFTPAIEVKPETEVADSPTGLSVNLKVPQSESVTGLAEANLKEAVVTLPAGMTVNPSAANGLGACSETQIGLDNADAPSCPRESKLANVKVVTPLLEEPLHGAVYLAQQGNLAGNGSNPYGSLFAIYLVAEGSGVLVKLPGEVTLDQSTGQLTARFGEDPTTGQFLPQLPFSELKMEFFGGPGAALVTPSGCGTYTTTSLLTPWSAPASGPPVTPESGFPITSGCAGGLTPSFSAGTVSNLAGSFSPLLVRFSRQDGEQELHAVQLQLPPGLLGEIAHVPLCGEAQAKTGTCGEASEIGMIAVAVGAGPDPYWITDGHAYLTGPYDGQPFGLSIVVPAVAGPFNVGSEGRPVVVRAAISVNPQTAAVTITSKPFPQILQGVPLQIRTVDVNADRPDFTLNPTSCAPMSVTGTLQGSQGASAALSVPYQAAGCANLPFKPSFAVSVQGAASKANGASLDVEVAQKPGEANIHKVDVQLPTQLPSRLTTLQKACAEQQFAANPAGCPEGSFVGYAAARTPVLNAPLSGPAILVSHGGAAFPDLDVILQGEGVTIDLTGKTDIKKGITYSRFETVPDAPISSFELKLPEGSHSVLAAYLPTKANYSFCGQSLTMPTTIIGQNGAQVTQTTKIAVTGCDSKPLTRAQKLAKVIRVCKRKRNKSKRTHCEAEARRRYGPRANKSNRRRKR